MKKRTIAALLISHLLTLAVGFGAGIYLLPILIAPPPPDEAALALAVSGGEFTGEFIRDRKDSDAFHWGEGKISIGADAVSFMGKLAPGPDYRLYLSPEFVETELDFNRLKSEMVEVGSVKTFENFIVPLASDIDPSKYSAVIVWCESFGQFITSATYQSSSE